MMHLFDNLTPEDMRKAIELADARIDEVMNVLRVVQNSDTLSHWERKKMTEVAVLCLEQMRRDIENTANGGIPF